jgi:hypothetical protein
MMWQHHYYIHHMRMEQLRLEAEHARRWRLQDVENNHAAATANPGRGRVLVARGIATVSRAAARVARRLDARANVALGPDGALRDA